MSRDVSNAHSQSTIRWSYVVAAALVSAAAVALISGATSPMRVTVDGVPKVAPAGATIQDLRDSGMFQARSGNLLSVKGGVLKVGGGQPAVVLRDGRAAAMTQRVYDGDAIVSHSGADRFEETVTVQEPIAPATREQGQGPVLKLAQEGTPGLREVRRGKVSGIVLSQKVLKPSVETIVVRTAPSPTDKLVALTFDDGPSRGQTDKILDVLKAHGVHATFFMLGGSVKKNPEVARRVVAEGNVAGNHTLGHELLTKRKPAEIARQIRAGADTIERATGVRPVWFRPPYGAMNSAVWQQARKLKVRVVMWDIDSNDWRKPGVDRIVRNAENPVRPGAIILMHDGGGGRAETIAALPRIIEDLKAKGYVFVTLDELVGR